jgi:hypothetical protein
MNGILSPGLPTLLLRSRLGRRRGGWRRGGTIGCLWWWSGVCCAGWMCSLIRGPIRTIFTPRLWDFAFAAFWKKLCFCACSFFIVFRIMTNLPNSYHCLHLSLEWIILHLLLFICFSIFLFILHLTTLLYFMIMSAQLFSFIKL